MTPRSSNHTVASIAQALSGELLGDATLRVSDIAHVGDVAEPTVLALAMAKGDIAKLSLSRAKIAVVARGASVPPGILDAYIAVPRPRIALCLLTRLFDRPVTAPPGNHVTAVVDPSAVIGANVSIGAFARIGANASIGDGSILMAHVTIGADAVVGRDCLFHPGARIGERVRVGDRVIVQMNAVVGADGFSFVPPQPGAVETAKATGQVGGSNAGVQRVNSIGTVVLHDEVEIGPCSTIDRATIAATVIGRGTKLANMVTVAHNCTIGENCMISGHVGIAGSSTIGNRVVLGGQVGISDHIRVGDDSIVAAKAKVIRDVPPKSVMMGVPAAPRSEFFAQQLREARMTRYFGQVDALARRIAAIEGKMRDSGGIGR